MKRGGCGGGVGGGGTDLQILGFQMGVEEVQKTLSQVAAKSAFYLRGSQILSFLLFRGRRA